MYYYQAAVVLFVIYCIGQVIYRLFFSPLRKIPGPFLARISILWHFYYVLKGDLRTKIRQVHDKYGPVVRINYREVSVCNEEAVRKILVPPVDKHVWYRIFAMPDSTFLNQMSRLSAADFIPRQKKVMRGFSLAAILQSEDKIDYSLGIFKRQIEGIAAREGSVPFNEWFTYFAFDIVGLTTFSKEFGFLKAGADVDNCVKMSEQLCRYLAIMAFFPNVHDVLEAFLSPLMKLLHVQPMKHVLNTTEKALKVRGADPEKGKDMVAHWKEEGTDGPMSDLDMFSTANANVAAGGDTVGSFMQGFVYQICRHPPVQQRLQQELDEAARNGLISSPVKYDAAMKLPYLQACIKELYRVHAGPTYGMARIAPEKGIEIEGYFFPAGTILSVNLYALNYIKSLFGEDVDTFNPDRWLGERGAALEKHFYPFGAGYMTCPGRHLGHIEMSKMMATLFLDYDLALANPEKEWKLAETVILKPYDWKAKVTVRTGPKV